MSLQGSVFCQSVIKDELPCIAIQHPKFDALISLQGAQLLEFKPTHKAPLLWLSPLAEFKKGQSPRGGIPICWPWFGNADKNPKSVLDAIAQPQQAHGFARSQQFQVEKLVESSGEVQLTLSLEDNRATRKIWPFAFKLTVSLTLSEDIKLSLRSENTGDTAFHFTQALHSYFPSNIADTQVLGAASYDYVDALDQWSNKQENGTLSIEKEVDRIVRHGGPYRIIDNQSKTQLFIESNANDAIIWNPWIAKSKRLSQFANDAYQDMLCIESGNVLNNAVTLAPNEQHELILHVQALG